MWIFMKQEMMRWQWHQLDHMQIIYLHLSPVQTDTTLAPHYSIFHRPDTLPEALSTVSNRCGSGGKYLGAMPPKPSGEQRVANAEG